MSSGRVSWCLLFLSPSILMQSTLCNLYCVYIYHGKLHFSDWDDINELLNEGTKNVNFSWQNSESFVNLPPKGIDIGMWGLGGVEAYSGCSLWNLSFNYNNSDIMYLKWDLLPSEFSSWTFLISKEIDDWEPLLGRMQRNQRVSVFWATDLYLSINKLKMLHLLL